MNFISFENVKWYDWIWLAPLLIGAIVVGTCIETIKKIKF